MKQKLPLKLTHVPRTGTVCYSAVTFTIYCPNIMSTTVLLQLLNIHYAWVAVMEYFNNAAAVMSLIMNDGELPLRLTHVQSDIVFLHSLIHYL